MARLVALVVRKGFRVSASCVTICTKVASVGAVLGEAPGPFTASCPEVPLIGDVAVVDSTDDNVDADAVAPIEPGLADVGGAATPRVD